MRLIAISFLLLFHFVSKAQNFDSTLSLYFDKALEEKAHVHFDKELYNKGETVWFKAYLLTHTWPSALSTNFYAELIDATGKVVQRKLFPVYEASASGHFDLPLKPSGNYLFRGYTTWMRNFDTAFFFTKPIVLTDAAAATTSAPAPSPVLRFFPEGGNAVAGLPNFIAFKATVAGMPVAASGEVRDEAGAVVTGFSTEHDGMGQFTLTPIKGKQYISYWQTADGAKGSTTLPAAVDEGVALHVTPAAENSRITISRSAGGPKIIQVYVLMNQQTLYKNRLDLSGKAQHSFRLPTGSLPSGVVQVTVFSETYQPLAERIFFTKGKDDLFTPVINIAQKNLEKRGKNVIEVEVPDTLKANLSLAITDAQLTDEPFRDNILSRLQLTSELRGYVHNPAYYFQNSSDSLRNKLDLVMLTNGWRRYNWTDIAAGKAPTILYKPENYLSLKGRVEGLRGEGAELNIILDKDSNYQFVNVPVKKDGSFLADGLIYFDTVTLRYNFNKNKALNSRTVVNFTPGYYSGVRYINNDAYPVYVPGRAATVAQRAQFFSIEADEMRPALARKMRTLENVTVQTRTRSRTQELDKRYASPLFQGGDGFNFDLTDNTQALGFQDIFQFLQGRVPGLQINGAFGNWSLLWRGYPTAVFLDEMPVDANTLSSIPVTDVAYVKVLRPPFIGAVGSGAGGAVAIYTRRGNDGARSNAPGLAKGQIVGYNSGKEFYSPDYATDSPLHDVTDVRSTLLWKPYILTDAVNRKVRIEFYNNDLSKKLRLVLEGVNAGGKLARVEQVIE